MSRPARPLGGTPAASLARSGLLLAVATTAANLCGYGFTLVVSRRLGPGEYGAIGALLNLTLIAAVPPLALQLVAARVTARASCADDPHQALHRAAGGLLAAAAVTAAVLGVAMVLAAGSLEAFLHLDGEAPALLSAGVVVAGTGSSLVQGVLQGCERFPALSLVYVVAGATRFAGGALAASAGGGQTGVMAATCLAAVLTAGIAAAIGRRAVPEFARGDARQGAPVGEPDGVPRAEPDHARPDDARPDDVRLGRQVLTSTASTAGLFLLLNIDVLLARHYLPREASGLYAVGSLFGKAAFWAPQFLATLLYPGMATPHRRRAAVVHGLTLTAAAGLAVVSAAAIGARPALRWLFGAAYLPLASNLWIFAALGAVLAVVQVLVYAHLAAGDGRWGSAASVVAGAVWALVAWRLHDTVADVAGTALAGACLLAVIGTATAIPRMPRPVEPSGPSAGVTRPVPDGA